MYVSVTRGILNPEVPFFRQPFKHTTHANIQSLTKRALPRSSPSSLGFFVRRWIYAFATVLGDTNDATGIYRAVCTYSVLEGAGWRGGGWEWRNLLWILTCNTLRISLCSLYLPAFQLNFNGRHITSQPRQDKPPTLDPATPLPPTVYIRLRARSFQFIKL